jgi:hypothetical protein
MATKTKTEVIKRLILAILNAKSTDEAGEAIFRHGQIIVPEVFVFKDGKPIIFIPISVFESLLTNDELQHVRSLHEKECLRESIDSLIITRMSPALHLRDYDAINKKFSVGMYTLDPNHKTVFEKIECNDLSDDELLIFLEQHCTRPRFVMEILTKFQEFKDLEERLRQEKSRLQEKDYSDLLWKYKKSLRDQEVIRRCQDEARSLVNNVIETKQISPDLFDPFLHRCNKVVRAVYSINEHGSISVELTLMAMPSDIFLLQVDDIVAWCVVEFFRIGRNAELTKHCDFCKKYFIAKKVDDRIKFCPGCSRLNKLPTDQRTQYQRKRRKKLKADKNAEGRKERIKHMIRQGWPPKEAERIADDD